MITLPDILPKRKCSFRLKGFFDPNSQMLKELLQLKGLLPKLSYLTKKHLGYDIMEYTSHIGNVYILHNNEIFRNIDFSGIRKTKWTSYANEIQEAICRFFKSENNAV